MEPELPQAVVPEEGKVKNENVELIKELLLGAVDPEVVNRIVDPTATYVSLTYDNPELRRVMPWAGTHKDGPAGILWTFQQVNSFWKIENLRSRTPSARTTKWRSSVGSLHFRSALTKPLLLRSPSSAD